MSNKSILDMAYDVIVANDSPIAFGELWNRIAQMENLDKKGKIGKFYTDLLTDGRFVNLGDNHWDIRAKYTYDKAHIDMGDCYTDEEEEESEDPEDLLVEKKTTRKSIRANRKKKRANSERILRLPKSCNSQIQKSVLY